MNVGGEYMTGHARQGACSRLLVIGDAVAPTGFATVTRNLCRGFQGFEIHQLGINYHGDPHDEPWKIYPAGLGGDPHGVRRLRSLVEALRPDLIFAVNDPWILGAYMEQIRDLSPRPKIVMYTPVDLEPLEPLVVERLEGADKLVVYTRFGKHVFEQAIALTRMRRPDFYLPAIEILPHGVDARTFHPLEAESARARREKAVCELFPARPDLRESFIVLNANRNQPRKRIDLTIKGFASFAKNKPANVKLYLHMGVEDCGWHIGRLAERYGIQERLLASTSNPGLPCLPPGKLNSIYNAAAVGVNTSCGEGWGLVSFEHAATGAAQIVPRHSACEELWEGSALLLDPAISLTTEKMLSEARIVSPDDLAEALERLYEDPVLLEELSWAAYRNATRPEYRWSEIARRWEQMFHELLGISVQREPASIGLADAA